MISFVGETTGYPQLCKKTTENDSTFSRFKREPEYRGMEGDMNAS